MTYRFLIVDDEYFIRQRIRLCIPWKDYGFEFSGEAANSRQAEDFLEKNQVDLIILDLSMPGENGLELARRLREKGQTTKIIILTGFSTFEYAREAIGYNVSCYLLKPIQTSELTEALLYIKKELDQQYAIQTERMEYHHTKTVAKEASSSLFFQSVISGFSPADDGHLPEHGIFPQEPYLLFLTDGAPFYLHRISYEQKQSFRRALGNLVDSWLDRHHLPTAIPFFDTYHHLVYILPTKHLSSTADDLFKHLCTDLSQTLIPQADILTGYGIASQGTGEHLSDAYRTALNYLTFKTVYGKDIKQPDSIPPRYQLERLQMLQETLKNQLFQNCTEKIQQTLDELFSCLRSHPISIPSLETELSSLLALAISYSATFQISMEGSNQLNCTGGEILHSGHTLEEIQEKFQNLYLSVAQTQEDEALPTIHKIVIQATELIQREFTNVGLGLDSIASTLLISPAYLSRNFKRIKGISVMQYLTRCRMEYAMKQLKETPLTIAQVAEQSGYQDSFYFSKRFKQMFGVSPSHISRNLK